MSSSTISSVATSTDVPERTTVARGSVITSRRWSSRRDRVSCTTPMTEFATTTPTNRPSWGLPEMTTSTNSVTMIALTIVKVLATTIWPNDRSGGAGTTFT